MGKEELRQALALAAGCNSEDVQIGEIGVSKGGLGSAWVKCPAAGARKLAQAGKVVLGWSIARVSAIPKRPLQCFKCLELGRTGEQPPPPHYRHHIGKRRRGGGRAPRIHERGMRRLHATLRPGRQKRSLRVLVDTGNSRYASELRPGPEKISKGASPLTDT